MSNTERPIKHALNLLMACVYQWNSLLQDGVISVPGETEKVISKQSNNNNAHYYSLKLACKQKKKSGVCEAQTATTLPRANEEPAGGGAQKTDNVGLMFISCCVPIALQGLTLTSGINMFPSNISVMLVCSMKRQQLHLHVLLLCSNILERYQDYDL